MYREVYNPIMIELYYILTRMAVSSYPSDTSVANVSKSTTKRELISIEGVSEDVFRMNNLNLVLGSCNSLEYGIEMFNLPKPEELLKLMP